MNISEDKLNALLGRFVGDLGATMHAGSIVIGESLGLYKAMRTPNERVTAADLAKRTGTDERYVREWLNTNAAGGYVEYDKDPKHILIESENIDGLTYQKLGTKSPAGWAYDYGKGRVCYLSPGHLITAMWNPEYEKIQRNAVRWLLREI